MYKFFSLLQFNFLKYIHSTLPSPYDSPFWPIFLSFYHSFIPLFHGFFWLPGGKQGRRAPIQVCGILYLWLFLCALRSQLPGGQGFQLNFLQLTFVSLRYHEYRLLGTEKKESWYFRSWSAGTSDKFIFQFLIPSLFHFQENISALMWALPAPSLTVIHVSSLECYFEFLR